MSVYYASKAFVLSFSEALWREAAGTGVHVSCLCPGPTTSNFRERAGTGSTRLAKRPKMTSEEVARLGYAGFQNNDRVVVTGFTNALGARLAPLMPRTAVLNSVYALQSPK
jgi:short-subunit dehydrogenase